MASRFATAAGFLASLAAVATIGCKHVTGPSDKVFNATVMKAMLTRNLTRIPRLAASVNRIVLTAKGTPQTGVTLTTISGGVDATAAVDLDGDGVMESSIAARLLYLFPQSGIDGGANMTITSISFPLVSGTGHTRLTLGGTIIFLDQSDADLLPKDGNPEILILEANLEITPAVQVQDPPLVLGHTDFKIGTVTGTIVFEPNGSGGVRMRVTGSTFAEFTVP